MAREAFSIIANLSDPEMKRRARGALDAAEGLCEFTVKPRKNTRSLRQNSAWWGMIVTPLYNYLADQDVDVNSAEDVHEMLKDHFLKVPVFDKQHRLIGNKTLSTTTLTTAEFSQLFERARVWIQDRTGILIHDPDPEFRLHRDARAEVMS